MNKIYLKNLNSNCEPATDLFSKAIRFLKSNEYEVVDLVNDADTVIVNTCSVFTSEEDKAVKSIKNFLSKPHIEKVVFFGCAAATVKEFEGNDKVEQVGPKDLEKMNELFSHKIPMNDGGVNNFIDGQYEEQTSENLNESDLYIHISQGCNHSCTFCNIKSAKGGVTSKSIESIRDDIISYIQKVRKDSYEFVLQSDDCGGYGHDIGGIDFVDLLDELSKIQKNIKYKVSNLHPTGLIELWPRLKKHLTTFSYINIPLESGSPRIMLLMYRFYNLVEVKKLLKKIKKISPETWLFSDYIINFPSETLGELKETLKSGEFYDEKRYINYSEHSGKVSEGIYPKHSPRETVERIAYVLDHINDTGDNAVVCGVTGEIRSMLFNIQMEKMKPPGLNI
jgi:tRNA A37 methylthiotransferase MiaB